MSVSQVHMELFPDLNTNAWELHSRFSPTLTFHTDQHEGQQTDEHDGQQTDQHEPLPD